MPCTRIGVVEDSDRDEKIHPQGAFTDIFPLAGGIARERGYFGVGVE
jgi:hypothetical protein